MGNSGDRFKFLFLEYQESYKQLRYYDDRQSSLFKYVGTISSAVATALLALLKLFIEDMDMFLIFQSGICSIIFIVIAIILSIMVRNRIYFTYVGRQLNAIRNFLLEKDAPSFRDNQMYRKTDLSALNFLSTQTLMMLAVAFISALYFSASIYSYSIIMHDVYDLERAAWYGVVAFAVEMIISSAYLLWKNKKTAD